MIKKKLIRSIICALAICAVSTVPCMADTKTSSFTISNKNVTLDPETAYKYVPLDNVLDEYALNSDKAKSKYNGQYVAVKGTVTFIDGVNYLLSIKGNSNHTLDVMVTESDSISEFGGIKKGDKIKVYGKLYSHIAGISLQARRIEKVASLSDESGTIELENGKHFNSKTSAERILGKGRMKYTVPAEWAEVEEKLDNIEGYQYKLNEIPKEYKTEPEQLYVYYFSNEKYLMDLTDKTKPDAIVKAIIKNILPKEDVPDSILRPKKTANGMTFDYYTTSFEDSSRKIHHVEFVFTTDGDEGMCCLLYIFNESNHKDDIIYMMRTLEIKG